MNSLLKLGQWLGRRCYVGTIELLDSSCQGVAACRRPAGDNAPGTKQVQQVVANRGLDLKSVSAGPGALVYEQFGSLHLYDLTTHQEHAVPVSISGDLPNIAPHWENVAAKELQNVAISPTGARVLVEARGDIYSVPAEKGDTRSLTRTPGAAERDPTSATG